MNDPPFVAETVSCQGCREIAEAQSELRTNRGEDPGYRVVLVHPHD